MAVGPPVRTSNKISIQAGPRIRLALPALAEGFLSFNIRAELFSMASVKFTNSSCEPLARGIVS
jgi:hypothetical protein